MALSRQVLRAGKRNSDKSVRQAVKVGEAAEARRNLLARQSAREKSGFYEGTRPVASCIAPSRSRITKRRVKKGQFGGRIIERKVLGREYQYHATKGYRSYRAA